MVSPLFQQINDLEELLNKSADDAGAQALASAMMQGMHSGFCTAHHASHVVLL
jgi:hypothetical protein